ncbi:Xaa-Pro aminopeptidase [Malassezia vespertilionis]|uniref:FACT complex subunit n=1 Tax=Malassezia vespertilionis TaxID=2020962 RepID=A0A2N1JGW0_9BASI|nr:Xaa-Pro aminopeptidase [Malassezia vespertilionis]PKI85782.1 Spt16p [Malassezia vespertilionis]WFD05338.1 Xaa-Pro aminopeptidase [Malassezia vespertilionis]
MVTSPSKRPGGRMLRSRARTSGMDESVAFKLKEHQRELVKQKQDEGLARFKRGDAAVNNDDEQGFKKYESYRRESMLPAKVDDLRIMVDLRAQSIILPISAYAVPFHIKTVKNVSKSDEGDYTYLRINFVTPGQLSGKKDNVPFDTPDATFIRNVSYRSTDARHMDALFNEITEMRRVASKREADRKELADIVEQDQLVLNKARPLTLPEVFPRPALEGKRVPGGLTIHQNGVRFASPLRPDQRIDIPFSNVKHLFYQPCDGELIVLIHFHLKAPVMIGKRKTKDIQFYREASEVQFDETGNRKRRYRAGDEDEIELEQEERRMRHQLNKEFKHFSQRIADASEGRLQVDIPYRDLGFNGVPSRASVLLQPTTDCLVQLTDPPFLVVTLSEIEIVHLERVQYGLSSFDLVFVFSDFSRAPLHVSSIPTSSLDDVKQWLDSVDVAVTEGAVNLNWGAIMKTINDDPFAFFEEGGWSFLQGDASDASDAEDSETASEFGSDLVEDDQESTEYSESESDFGASDADSGEGSEEGEESEEGEDWDTLESNAAKEDRNKRLERGEGSGDESEDDEKPKVKRSK